MWLARCLDQVSNGSLDSRSDFRSSFGTFNGKQLADDLFRNGHRWESESRMTIPESQVKESSRAIYIGSGSQ